MKGCDAETREVLEQGVSNVSPRFDDMHRPRHTNGQGMSGLQVGSREGSIEPQKCGRWGVREKRSIVRHHSLIIMNTDANFCTLTMVKIVSPNTWQMMFFLNPFDALIPKIQFSFFANFGSESRLSVLLGIRGSCQFSPFWERGGSNHEALLTPTNLSCKPGCSKMVSKEFGNSMVVSRF